MIDVAAAADGNVIREQLEGNDIQHGQKQFGGVRNVEHVINELADVLVAFHGHRDDLAGTRC